MKPPRPGQAVICYRAVYEEFEDDPLPSRSPSGRFHDRATGRVTSYLAARAETAWSEVTHRWQADKDTYRMAEVQVKLSAIADLTDPGIQERYGIDEGTLTAEDYRICQQLAHRLRAEGFEAAWTYSRADKPEGRQLVILLDNLREGSNIEVRDVRRMR